MTSAIFQVWRGDRGQGQFSKYTTEISEGMVVLDAIHQIQAEQANDLGVRWNCKAGKCGSCSAEINGMPRLMCMTRMNELPADKPVQTAASGSAGRIVARLSRGCGPRAGIPEMHRMFLMPGCVSRFARTSTA